MLKTFCCLFTHENRLYIYIHSQNDQLIRCSKLNDIENKTHKVYTQHAEMFTNLVARKSTLIADSPFQILQY